MPSAQTTLLPDGFNATVVLDCGCTSRWNLHHDDRSWSPGWWDSCSLHSMVLNYDTETGDPNYNRDRRVVEVRAELAVPTVITPAMSVATDSPLGVQTVAVLRRLADIFEHDGTIRPNSVTFDAENGKATVSVSLKPL